MHVSSLSLPNSLLHMQLQQTLIRLDNGNASICAFCITADLLAGLNACLLLMLMTAFDCQSGRYKLYAVMQHSNGAHILMHEQST